MKLNIVFAAFALTAANAFQANGQNQAEKNDIANVIDIARQQSSVLATIPQNQTFSYTALESPPSAPKYLTESLGDPEYPFFKVSGYDVNSDGKLQMNELIVATSFYDRRNGEIIQLDHNKFRLERHGHIFNQAAQSLREVDWFTDEKDATQTLKKMLGFIFQKNDQP